MRSSTETILASLNTHGGRGADGRPYDLEAACRQLKADIIVLQEVWRPRGEPDPVGEIAAALGAEPLWTDLIRDAGLDSAGIADERARGRWGLVTLTSAPVLGFEVTGLGRIPGDLAPRAAQLVTVGLPGRGPLRIVNTHLTYRLLSPVQLVRLVRRLAADDIPTVIAGDLNMPLPVTGLAAGYAPAVNGRTYPAHRPLLQLDHILTSRRVARCGGEVLPRPAPTTFRCAPGSGSDNNEHAKRMPHQAVIPVVYGAWGIPPLRSFYQHPPLPRAGDPRHTANVKPGRARHARSAQRAADRPAAAAPS